MGLRGTMGEFVRFFALAFGALLPVMNPVGSSLVFLGMVGVAPEDVFRALARRIAINTALFLLAMNLAGAAVLKLFGVSLAVVQLGWLSPRPVVIESEVR
jgi:multiple antibiotic resistance protein